VSDPPRPARDLKILDAIDAFRREPLDAEVWRIVRNGRDPVLGSPSLSRWCDRTFDVLYASLDRDGAIAEIRALLSLQSVFPSKVQWFASKLRISAAQTLRLADLPTLARLGVDVDHYPARDFSRTQPIAEAAHFLGFDGLIAPSARWSRLNLVLFTERLAPSRIETAGGDEEPIAWDAWRKRTRAVIA
jgi:hypothetical protein